MATNRIDKIADVAERVILHFKDDPIARMRELYRIELRPFQWEWWYLMDQYPHVLCKACPRVGKTFEVEIKCLDWLLYNPFEDYLNFAPRLDQAEKSFSYQYAIVEKTPPIKSYIKRNAVGKPEFSKNGVKFRNGSSAKCFGVNSNFEGENASILRIEEYDEIPPDRIKNILGRGTGKNKNGLPTRIIKTGVVWGKLNIWNDEQNDQIFKLPPVDVYMALAGGYLDEKTVFDMRASMSDDEWLRTMCLMFVESRNFIWSHWLHVSQYVGLHWGLTPIPPLKGSQYVKARNSIITLGLDMGKQGAGDDASDYSMQVIEENGMFRRWLFGKTWPPDSDPSLIVNEVCDAWEFFAPNGGLSDSADANLAVAINEELYSRGLTGWNCHKLGENSQQGWPKWFEKGLLTPFHNTGRNKHNMYVSLRNAFNNCVNIGKSDARGTFFILPQVDRDKALIPELRSWKELLMLVRELENLVAEVTLSGYYKIERYKKKVDDRFLNFKGVVKLGDDRTDALAMANYAMDLKTGKHTPAFVKADYKRGF